MGLYFDVQCPQCGYEKSLTEGECGKEHLNNMRIKKEFELGKGNRALRTIYDAMAKIVSKKAANSIGFYVGDKPVSGSKEWEEARLMYGEPYIKTTPAIYKCYKCHDYFTHSRIAICCSKGTFREDHVKCPVCKSYDTRQMDVKEFFEDEALQTESDENDPHNGYICRVFCPQCGARLKVISSGIVDA